MSPASPAILPLRDLPLADARLLGGEIMARAEALGAISSGGPGVTRLLATPEHRRALDLIASWMHAAGMSTRIDGVGNLVGRFEGSDPTAPALVAGSHQDTVRQGGKFDGMLGIILPLVCLEQLYKAGVRLPYAIEVPAFADEEGVRYGTSLFGSRALAGTFDMRELQRVDENGISLGAALQAFGCDTDRIAEAAYAPGSTFGYLEVHIEQGPVLESRDLPVGVVDAIAGADRLKVSVTGEAGHAGTVPMNQRRDALAAAAEMVLAVEDAGRSTPRLVATVGRIDAQPSAINVIPGSASFTIDLRAPSDAVRATARVGLETSMQAIATRRGVSVHIDHLHSAPATLCDPALMAAVATAVQAEGIEPVRLYSGAGHDAMAIADLMPVAMLFVRCWRGVSHNPAESITADDAGIAARVWLRILQYIGA
jgi:allantoate deiminase